jgi:hypothetical protein
MLGSCTTVVKLPLEQPLEQLALTALMISASVAVADCFFAFLLSR